MKLREKLLKLGTAAIEQLTLPLKLKKDKHALEGWILKKETEVSELEITVQEAKGAESLDPDKILDATDSLEMLKVRLQQGKDLQTELFDTEVEIEK